MGCDFLWKYWIGFSSLTFKMGIFIYAVSIMIWKIISLLLRRMPRSKRDSNSKRNNEEREAMLEDHDEVGVLQNEVGEVGIQSEIHDEVHQMSKSVVEEQCDEDVATQENPQQSDDQAPDEARNLEVCSIVEYGKFNNPEGANNCIGFGTDQDKLLGSEAIIVEEKELETHSVTCFGANQGLDIVCLELIATEKKEIEGITTSIEDADAIDTLAVTQDITVAVEDTNEIENTTGAIDDTEAMETVAAAIGDENVIKDMVAVEHIAAVEDYTYASEQKIEDGHEEIELKVDELCAVTDEDDKQIYELDEFDGDVFMYVETLKLEQLKQAEKIRDLETDLLMITGDESMSADETTSKSSGSEWRNSTGRESELDDYRSSPVQSLGQSSDMLFETLYEKYIERMHYFDMLNSQQLYAVGFFHPKQLQKSKSQRIASSLRQFMWKKRGCADDDFRRQQKLEFETVYVAQTCLTWEALHWQYKKVQQVASSNIEPSLSYDHAAEQFQQFQVLLQRFLENEPFDQDLRIQVYVRSRCLLPKLLQVPSVKASMEEAGTTEDTSVSSTQLVSIMEGAIMTFWDFLKADKEKPSRLLLNMLWAHQELKDPADSALLHAIKRNLERKEMRLKDLRRRGKCVRKKKSDLSKGEEIEILLGLIDIKIVSRVLKMSRITKDHLRWCEEKLNKLIVCQGKLHRDSSPVLFPSEHVDRTASDFINVELL
eukprot:Gb_23279 [translate_table: standard]